MHSWIKALTLIMHRNINVCPTALHTVNPEQETCAVGLNLADALLVSYLPLTSGQSAVCECVSSASLSAGSRQTPQTSLGR